MLSTTFFKPDIYCKSCCGRRTVDTFHVNCDCSEQPTHKAAAMSVLSVLQAGKLHVPMPMGPMSMGPMPLLIIFLQCYDSE
mmetsp:Transcript_32524/g.97044  ORF Transcript_32524/g.97044 Transcript_32524/m.97044 type:complete len:81 (+) Transcript_32524:969-1211(+)